MSEDGGGKGVWAGLATVGVAAVVFLILWLMRGWDMDRLRADMRKAENAALSASQRLESELQTARSETAAAERKATELDKRLTDNARRAGEETAMLERRFRNELDAVSLRLTETTAQLEKARAGNGGTAEKGGDDLRGELDSARNTLEELRQSSEAKLTSMNRELNQYQQMIRSLEKRVADSAIIIAALEKDKAEALAPEKNPRAEPEQADAAPAAPDESVWRERMQAAEKELAAFKQDAAEKLAELEKRLAGSAAAAEADISATATLKERLDAAERELAREREQSAALEKNLAEAELALNDQTALANEAKAKAAKLEAALNEAAQGAGAKLALLEREHANRLQAAKNEASKRLEELDRNYRERQATLNGEWEAEKTILNRRAAELENETKRLSEMFGLSAPGRSIGTIVERLPAEQVLLITGGARQRMQPGMKFDVRRPVGGQDRRVGSVAVIRVLDEYSMAVSTYADEDALICPETGRAVLEPGARFSPFAVDQDGKPVPLKKAGTVEMALEAPAIGDLIDNPFYDPARPLTFALSPRLANNPCAVTIIDSLGGLPRTDAKGADFLIVAEDETIPASENGPRQITLEHLARYLNGKPGSARYLPSCGGK